MSAFGLGRSRAKTARRTGAHVDVLPAWSGIGVGTAIAGSGEAGKAGAWGEAPVREEPPTASYTNTASAATSASAATTPTQARALSALSPYTVACGVRLSSAVRQ
jgi:hypothetical protein